MFLVPVIKAKSGKLNSMDNYRLSAHASILSKELERIMRTRLEMLVLTTDNYSGNMCIYVYYLFKEMFAEHGGQTVFY